MSDALGQLTVHGDRATLRFERYLPYPVQTVWSAIADPAQRRAWIGETILESRRGGRFELVPSGPPLPLEHKRVTGRVLIWDPPHVLEHEWKQSIVDDGVVRYELRPDGDGTLLLFTHRGLSIKQANGFRRGTHAFLDRLEAYLGDRPLPQWTRRYREVADLIDEQNNGAN